MAEVFRAAVLEHLSFPKDYGPAKNAKATKNDWDHTIATYHRDLREMIAIVKSPKTDLHARIPHGDGQTILREAILIVDHTSYHAPIGSSSLVPYHGHQLFVDWAFRSAPRLRGFSKARPQSRAMKRVQILPSYL